MRPKPAWAGFSHQRRIAQPDRCQLGGVSGTIRPHADARLRNTCSGQDGAHLVQSVGSGGCVARSGGQIDQNSAGCLASPDVGKGKHVRALLAGEAAASRADEQLNCARAFLDRDVVAQAVIEISRNDCFPGGIATCERKACQYDGLPSSNGAGSMQLRHGLKSRAHRHLLAASVENETRTAVIAYLRRRLTGGAVEAVEFAKQYGWGSLASAYPSSGRDSSFCATARTTYGVTNTTSSVCLLM